MLNKMQCIDNNINELNPGEGGDEPSQAVDHEIAPEERSRSQRSEAHAAERKGDEGDDDEAVEDESTEDGARRRTEPHDVEGRDNGEDTDQHGRAYRAILRD